MVLLFYPIESLNTENKEIRIDHFKGLKCFKSIGKFSYKKIIVMKNLDLTATCGKFKTKEIPQTAIKIIFHDQKSKTHQNIGKKLKFQHFFNHTWKGGVHDFCCYNPIFLK